MMNQSSLPGDDVPVDTQPVLFHDGCRLCLDIADTLRQTMPGLQVIDLGLLPHLKPAALARGVEQLPSLVVGGQVLPVSPHSFIDSIDVH